MNTLPLKIRMNFSSAIAAIIQGAGQHFKAIENGRPNTIEEVLPILILASQDIQAGDPDPDPFVVGAKVQLVRLGFPGHNMPLFESDKWVLYLIWIRRYHIKAGRDEPWREASVLVESKLRENGDPRSLIAAMWKRCQGLWQKIETIRLGHKEEETRIEKRLSALLPEDLKLADHQLAMVRCIEASKHRYILTDDMGLGKTIEAIASLLLLGKDAFPIVIACPLSVTYNWQKEIEKWMSTMSPVVRRLTPHTCGKDGKKSCKVCKYIKVDIPEDTKNGKNLVLIGSWQQMITHQLSLQIIKPSTVIGDEFHYMANHSSARSRSFLCIRARAKYVLGLTGTLEPNGRHREAYAQIKAVDSNAFKYLVSRVDENGRPKGDWKAYAQKFCGPVRKEFGERTVTSYDGRSNNVEFGCLLAKYTLRRTKAQVFGKGGLPPKTRYRIPIPISDKDRIRIASIKDDVRANLMAKAVELEANLMEEGTSLDIIEKRTRAVLSSQAVSELGVMRKLIGHIKIPWTITRIKELTKADHRVVIFCEHNEIADAILEKAGKAIGADKILRGRGSMNGSKRGELVERAQSDMGIRVIILTRAFREGITLTSFDRTIHVQRWWVPAEEIQAEDRLYRIGQKRDVGIDFPVIDGSCDDAMADLMVWKETGQQQSQGAGQIRAYEWIMAK